MHYHYYHIPSFRIRCNTSDNDCLNNQSCHYSTYIFRSYCMFCCTLTYNHMVYFYIIERDETDGFIMIPVIFLQFVSILNNFLFVSGSRSTKLSPKISQFMDVPVIERRTFTRLRLDVIVSYL